MERRTAEDLRAMAEWLERAGIPLVVIAYPLDAVEPFDRVNRALRRVAEERRIALVEASDAVSRVPEDAREWLAGAHPNGPMYREIARDVLAPLLALEEG